MTNASNRKGNHHPAKGKRFTDEQKQQALELARAKVLPRTAIATIFGTTLNSLRRWEEEAERKAEGHTDEQTNRALAQHQPHVDAAQEPLQTTAPPRSPYQPHDPGHGLGEHEIAAILELKQQHPSMGPAQIRAQLKRFKGWRVSNKAIARVLRDGGHELVHRGSRPQGAEPTRFEAPRRNALWQIDFAEVRTHPQHRQRRSTARVSRYASSAMAERVGGRQILRRRAELHRARQRAYRQDSGRDRHLAR